MISIICSSNNKKSSSAVSKNQSFFFWPALPLMLMLSHSYMSLAHKNHQRLLILSALTKIMPSSTNKYIFVCLCVNTWNELAAKDVCHCLLSVLVTWSKSLILRQMSKHEIQLLKTTEIKIKFDASKKVLYIQSTWLESRGKRCVCVVGSQLCLHAHHRIIHHCMFPFIQTLRARGCGSS